MESVLLWGFLGIFIYFGIKKMEEHKETPISSSHFTRWDDLFKKYSIIYGVPFIMLKAIAMNESSLGENPRVKLGLERPDDILNSISDDGKSWGLMQMTLTTARDYDIRTSPLKLNDPDYSIKLAANHLRRLKSIFGEEEFVVKAYNQGEGRTAKEIQKETPGAANGYWQRYLRNKAKIIQIMGAS